MQWGPREFQLYRGLVNIEYLTGGWRVSGSLLFLLIAPTTSCSQFSSAAPSRSLLAQGPSRSRLVSVGCLDSVRLPLGPLLTTPLPLSPTPNPSHLCAHPLIF